MVTNGHSCNGVVGHGDLIPLVHGDKGGAHAEAGRPGNPRLHCKDLLDVQLIVQVLDPGVVFLLSSSLSFRQVFIGN